MAPFEYAVASRFEAFEWLSDKKCGGGWQESDVPAENREYIRQTAALHDISLSVHLPCHFNPFKPDSSEILRTSTDFARQIGASLLVTHLSKDRGLQAFVDALRPAVDRLSAEGLRLAIENTVDINPEDFNRLFDLFPAGALDKKSVGMCLDVGHANLNEETRNDYLKYMDSLGPHVPIIHVHMHENYGDYDNHLTVFTGPSSQDDSGIRGLFRRLVDRGFSGCIIMEQWPSPADLLDRARNRLLEVVSDSISAYRRPKPWF
jgi:sugar phosphate isomerase/epimerase